MDIIHNVMHADIHLQALVWCDAAQRLLYINHKIQAEVGTCKLLSYMLKMSML